MMKAIVLIQNVIHIDSYLTCNSIGVYVLLCNAPQSPSTPIFIMSANDGTTKSCKILKYQTLQRMTNVQFMKYFKIQADLLACQ